MHRIQARILRRLLLAGAVALSALTLFGGTAYAATHPSPIGVLTFTIVKGSGAYSLNGYVGTLTLHRGVWQSSPGDYSWHAYSYPAVSGDNIPTVAEQKKKNVGPIPAYTYDFGFISGSYVGYQSVSDASYDPGRWPLDPFNSGAPYGRNGFYVHGGSGSHQMPAHTEGCIRLLPSGINSLHDLWSGLANKKDNSGSYDITVGVSY